MSLGSGGRVWRRAIAGPSRWTACRAWRGCGGRRLLVVLLSRRRLRCHGGHGVQSSRRACGCCVRTIEDSAGGAVLLIEWAGAGRALALVPAGSRCCALANRKRLRSGEDVYVEQLGAPRESLEGRWPDVSRRKSSVPGARCRLDWCGRCRLFTCSGWVDERVHALVAAVIMASGSNRKTASSACGAAARAARPAYLTVAFSSGGQWRNGRGA